MTGRICYIEETYRGYDICRWYGLDGYFVEYDGDEIQFEDVQDAELFIDTLYA